MPRPPRDPERGFVTWSASPSVTLRTLSGRVPYCYDKGPQVFGAPEMWCGGGWMQLEPGT
jgi:hypothetical protein